MSVITAARNLLIGIAILAGTGPALAAPDGRAIYNFRCYYCHGYSGDARTLAASMLAPAPRDFTAPQAATLGRERMIQAVRDGRPGTAMKPFGNVLNEDEIAAVVDFVRAEFIQAGEANTRYHTAANGWPDHQRFAIAFPFVSGEIPLDATGDELTAEQAAGRRLYMRTCISCHDVGREAGEATPAWETEAVSYPRTGFATGDFLKPVDADAVTGATPYAKHEIPPVLPDKTPQLALGERLFQDNCAFCHAADGTGKNWIGTFMNPHPRNLTDASVMQGKSVGDVRRVIERGLEGTSMPAWGGVLDGAQIDAIVAYIDEVFFPLRRDQ